MEYRQIVKAPKAPVPRPVLSSGMVHNGLVFCSGQLPTDPATGKLKEGTIKDRAHQVLANLSAVLEAAGTDLDHVIKVNVFIMDMKNYPLVNEVYGEYFKNGKPARTCVAMHQLPGGADVEMECIAVMPKLSEKL